MGLSVPGHSQGDSFCLCLTGHVQGLWGSGRDACVLRPWGDLYKVLKVPSFPEKLLQFSLKVGHVDSTPSLGVSQSHPQTPLNSLSKSRGHSSGLLCFLQAHERLPLLPLASIYGPSEFWKSLPGNSQQWSEPLSHQWRMREGNRAMSRDFYCKKWRLWLLKL